MTVRLTDFTADAETGTVSCAWSCRGADFASIAPRSHEDAPSFLLQPKLNPGARPLAGVACSRTVASGTLPPAVQALTVHRAALPRSLLACAPATWTQRLTCGSCGTALAPLCALAPVEAGVAVGLGSGFGLGLCFLVRVAVGDCFAVGDFSGVCVAVGDRFGVRVCVGADVAGGGVFALVRVADGVALSEALGVLVRVGDADGLACDVVLVDFGVPTGFVGVFVGDCDGVAAGLDVSVRVGAGVGSDEVVPEPVAPDGDGLADRLALELPVAVGDGLVVAVVDVVAVGVGVVGVVLGVVAVGVGVVGVVLGVVGVEVGVVGVVVGEVGVVGVGFGVVGVAVGVCEVGVGEGDGLGDELGSCSGSHDLPLDVVAALAVVVPAATARLTPEIAVSRTLPVIRVTVTGRACAKRINALPSAARYCYGTTRPLRSGFIRGDSSALSSRCPIGHQASGERHPLSYPVARWHHRGCRDLASPR
jgi:hypothetical protein